MKFRLIPPGEFLMGSTTEEREAVYKSLAPDHPEYHTWFDSESPQHKVVLTRPIYVGVHEVTQKQFSDVLGRNPSAFANAGAEAARVAGLDTSNHPVEKVRESDAVEFCLALSAKESLPSSYVRGGNHVGYLKPAGYGLPTEAEWEFACRAGTITKYWTGPAEPFPSNSGWTLKNSDFMTHRVGGRKANPFGLFDMTGNVWERIGEDWHSESYERFRDEPAVDPAGYPFDPGATLLRGGAFDSLDAYQRSATRRWFMDPYSGCGFRVMLPVDAAYRIVKLRPNGQVQQPAASSAP